MSHHEEHLQLKMMPGSEPIPTNDVPTQLASLLFDITLCYQKIFYAFSPCVSVISRENCTFNLAITYYRMIVY